MPPVTGFAFLDDKNNNSGGVVGLDLVADPTSFDSKGRPTRLTFTADPNVYGGIFFVDSAVGPVTITYHKNTAQAAFNGRIYTSGLTSPFENVDLYNAERVSEEGPAGAGTVPSLRGPAPVLGSARPSRPCRDPVVSHARWRPPGRSPTQAARGWLLYWGC